MIHTHIVYPEFVSTLLRRLNDFREGENTLHPEWKVKLQPLHYSKELEKACFYFFDHKEKMVDKSKDFHCDDNGRDPFDRMKKLKIKFIEESENIVSFTNGDSVYEICERWKKVQDIGKILFTRILHMLGLAIEKIKMPLLLILRNFNYFFAPLSYQIYSRKIIHYQEIYKRTTSIF